MIPVTEIAENGIVLHSPFVLTIRNHNDDLEYIKARLVILRHCNPEKPRVVNEPPTVFKSSVRILVALIVRFGFPLLFRDITFAFLPSKAKLESDFYIRLPSGEDILKSIGAPYGSILNAIQPQNRLAEALGH